MILLLKMSEYIRSCFYLQQVILNMFHHHIIVNVCSNFGSDKEWIYPIASIECHFWFQLELHPSYHKSSFPIIIFCLIKPLNTHCCILRRNIGMTKVVRRPGPRPAIYRDALEESTNIHIRRSQQTPVGSSFVTTTANFRWNLQTPLN